MLINNDDLEACIINKVIKNGLKFEGITFQMISYVFRRELFASNWMHECGLFTVVVIVISISMSKLIDILSLQHDKFVQERIKLTYEKVLRLENFLLKY